MWSKKQKAKAKPRSGAADTLITVDTKITGDIEFTGVLFVDGHVKGDITANNGEHSFLTVGTKGHIEGEIRVPQVMIYGYVNGNVHTSEHLNLQKESQVEGNVYYNLLEMAMGASVNGKLVKKDTSTKLLNHSPDIKKTKAKAKTDADDLKTTLDKS